MCRALSPGDLFLLFYYYVANRYSDVVSIIPVVSFQSAATDGRDSLSESCALA